MRNHTFIIAAAAMYSCTLLACGPSEKPIPNSEAATNMAGGTLAGPPPNCDCNDLKMAQFAKDKSYAGLLHIAFPLFFNTAKPLTFADIKLAVPAKYIDSLDSIDAAQADCKGLRIHYALNDFGKPVFLFSMDGLNCTTPTTSKHVTYRIIESTKYYSWSGSTWDEVPASDADDMIKAYRANMTKLSTGELVDTDTTDPNNDYGSVLFPYAELKALVDHNLKKVASILSAGPKLAPLEKAKEITVVNFCWAAEIGWNGSLKHIVVMIPTLDGENYDAIEQALTMKAANLSNGCPPICPSKEVSYERK